MGNAAFAFAASQALFSDRAHQAQTTNFFSYSDIATPVCIQEVTAAGERTRKGASPARREEARGLSNIIVPHARALAPSSGTGAIAAASAM